jgi:hypothetical protein
MTTGTEEYLTKLEKKLDGRMCACKVKYLGKNGTDTDKLQADRQLKVGKVYSIYRIDIEDWKTRISLTGLPNDFNSVMFEPIDWIK